MKQEIKTLIQNINEDNISSAKKVFQYLMADKIKDILAKKKVETAKKFFNKK